MTPERYDQIGQVCYEALQLEAEQRAAYLDRICSADADLRRQVDALLINQDQAGSFIENRALDIVARELAASEDCLRCGQKIGRYEVASLLARGGMGDIYLARDERLGRRVALKFLPAEFTRNRARLARFEQEARAASALNHPNIVTIYDIGEIDGVHFMATEFIEGETLRHRLERDRLSLLEVLAIGAQVAGALTAAHKAGIIHRDIKPENVMLRTDGYLKVVDFGLAKLTEPFVHLNGPGKQPDILTTPGLLIGTVNYMSPEQARGFDLDERSDIFNLGVMIYEMTTGHWPFVGETASDVIASILHSEPKPLARHLPDIPGELQRIVSMALAREKGQRYQTMNQLCTELKCLTQELEFRSRLERDNGTRGIVRGAPLLNPDMVNDAGPDRDAGNAVDMTWQLICPICQAHNPGIAKFCLSCGVSLINSCSACGNDLRPGTRFCASCGLQVGGITLVDNDRHSRSHGGRPGWTHQ